MAGIRICVIAVWLVVWIYMSPAIWALIRGEPRSGDPARAACFGYATVSILLTTRSLLLPENEELWAFCYALSICVALYTLHAAKAYGRGKKL